MSKVIKNLSLHNSINAKSACTVSVQSYKLRAIKLASDLRRANNA